MKAAIYLRISLDTTGERLAVDRQRTDCQRIAQQRGWEIVEEYVDNSVSASRRDVNRPAYDCMVADYAAGRFNALICWDLDRLTRQPRQLEDWIDAAEEEGLRLVTANGEADLSTDGGRMYARIKASVARAEVERKGARQRRANRQRAEGGHIGWTRRPFGFDRDRARDSVVVVEEEAELIRAAAARVLAGAPIGALVKEWNAAGITTSTGGTWTTTTLRRVLQNPRLAGRAVYRGQDMGEGAWPAILEPETFARLEETLRDPRRRTAPDTTARKHLLSGLARCGVCEQPLYASPYGSKGRRYMVYRCHAYHITRRMDLVDGVVENTVKATLAHPGIIARLTPNVDVDGLRAEAVELRDRRDALASMLAEGLMSGAAVREQAAKITRRIRALEEAIAAATGDNPAATLAAAPDVAAAWDAADLATKRAVIDTLMAVTLLPAGKGTRFREEHVQMRPRV
ncbi:recombinase family protein [Georgenia sp. AZ-5]|uniref:recombinase family protein n=1 Tax=Georgenia sp. AZ-5 TaxID=3367526 RepID=UPI0037549E5B